MGTHKNHKNSLKIWELFIKSWNPEDNMGAMRTYGALGTHKNHKNSLKIRELFRKSWNPRDWPLGLKVI